MRKKRNMEILPNFIPHYLFAILVLSVKNHIPNAITNKKHA